MVTRDVQRTVANGWMMVFLLFTTGILIASGIVWGAANEAVPVVVVLALLGTVWLVCAGGFFTLQPNEAAALILFGKYVGTVRESGFHWANPFYLKRKVSLRRRNLNGATIKVNDLRGNPIEIAAVMVWRVADAAKAIFDVDHFENYVAVQSEAALRHMAMAYPYDDFHATEEISLRGSTDEVSKALQQEVQERVAPAGVVVEETRLAHLAYAAEIAGAMLQRQQAEAVVAARSRIVEGAVGMVEMALDKLEESKRFPLDDERKAAMVSNLLVVLCSHESTRPVVNAGTLYQ
ncbi:MAG TPA: SPFH domain-containing protein [Candidatus Hydrogenedentes bacterium]|nr:SPFH domain-containing protein [Candidatus Hydrogenedentota bacterium]